MALGKKKKSEDAEDFDLEEEEKGSRRSRQRKEQDDASDSGAKKIDFSFKILLYLIPACIAAALLLIFIFDWTGWRSTLRDKMTTTLLGKEKEVITARLEFEYEYKLKNAIKDAYNEERAVLVRESESLKELREELEKKQLQLDNLEKSLNVMKEDLKLKEEEIDNRIYIYENSLIEAEELARIYQSMDAANAARILQAQQDIDKVIKILKNMKKETAASILELMETQKAADILSKLN